MVTSDSSDRRVRVARGDLQTLLERLVLGENGLDAQFKSDSDLQYALQHVARLLSAEGEIAVSTLFEVRLRAALHLAPREAIQYDSPTNLKPRWKLIQNFIKSEFGRDGDAVERLARDVAIVLERWDVKRNRHRGDEAALLLRSQNGRCKHCGLVLIPDAQPELLGDPYKPYHAVNDDWMSAEIDHIEPVSKFGTNDVENLQVLCRMCNQGKADGTGVDLRYEARYAAFSVGNISEVHRARMFYYVIDRCSRTCVRTNRTSAEVELTIRPVRAAGAYVRTNLVAVSINALEPGEARVEAGYER